MIDLEFRSEAGEGHKITVYVKYEDQLKEGCVDSDGKFYTEPGSLAIFRIIK